MTRYRVSEKASVAPACQGPAPPVRVVLVAGAALVAVYFLLPASVFKDGVYDAIGLFSAAATMWGVRQYRPRPARPWVLVAASLVLFSLGDLVYDVLAHGFGQDGFPTVGDVFYLASYPVLAAGVIGLLRARGHRRNTIALLDASFAALTFGTVVLVFFIEPSTRGDGAPAADGGGGQGQPGAARAAGGGGVIEAGHRPGGGRQVGAGAGGAQLPPDGLEGAVGDRRPDGGRAAEEGELGDLGAGPTGVALGDGGRCGRGGDGGHGQGAGRQGGDRGGLDVRGRRIVGAPSFRG